MSINQIVTHDGVFHADDVGAVAICHSLFPDAEIVRTREPDLIEPAVGRIVLDVGGRFEQGFMSLMVDHHQPGAMTTLTRGPGRPYATLGLLWNKTEIGRMYVRQWASIRQHASAHTSVHKVLHKPDTVEYLLNYADRVLIEPLDLRDCLGGQVHQGLPICHFGEMLGALNPTPAQLLGSVSGENLLFTSFMAAKGVFLMVLDQVLHQALNDRVTGTPVDLSQHSPELQHLAFGCRERALIFTAPLTSETARRKFEEDPKLEAVIYPDAAMWMEDPEIRKEYADLILTGLKWVVRARTAFDAPENTAEFQGVTFRHATGFLLVFNGLENVLMAMPRLKLEGKA